MYMEVQVPREAGSRERPGAIIEAMYLTTTPTIDYPL